MSTLANLNSDSDKSSTATAVTTVVVADNNNQSDEDAAVITEDTTAAAAEDQHVTVTSDHQDQVDGDNDEGTAEEGVDLVSVSAESAVAAVATVTIPLGSTDALSASEEEAMATAMMASTNGPGVGAMGNARTTTTMTMTTAASSSSSSVANSNANAKQVTTATVSVAKTTGTGSGGVPVLKTVVLQKTGSSPASSSLGGGPPPLLQNQQGQGQGQQQQQVSQGPQGQAVPRSQDVKVDNWGNYTLQRLHIMYDRGSFTDLTLQFHNGETVKMHRVVASLCTEYFVNLERRVGLNDKGFLALPDDIDNSAMLTVIKFFYTGKLEVRGNQFNQVYRTVKLMNISILTKLLEAHARKPPPGSGHQQQQVKKDPGISSTSGGSPTRPILFKQPATASATMVEAGGKTFTKIQLTAAQAASLLPGNVLTKKMTLSMGLSPSKQFAARAQLPPGVRTKTVIARVQGPAGAGAGIRQQGHIAGIGNVNLIRTTTTAAGNQKRLPIWKERKFAPAQKPQEPPRPPESWKTKEEPARPTRFEWPDPDEEMASNYMTSTTTSFMEQQKMSSAAAAAVAASATRRGEEIFDGLKSAKLQQQQQQSPPEASRTPQGLKRTMTSIYTDIKAQRSGSAATAAAVAASASAADSDGASASKIARISAEIEKELAEMEGIVIPDPEDFSDDPNSVGAPAITVTVSSAPAAAVAAAPAPQLVVHSRQHQRPPILTAKSAAMAAAAAAAGTTTTTRPNLPPPQLRKVMPTASIMKAPSSATTTYRAAGTSAVAVPAATPGGGQVRANFQERKEKSVRFAPMTDKETTKGRPPAALPAAIPQSTSPGSSPPMPGTSNATLITPSEETPASGELLTNHSKIISEVLKKYPQLVKDNKNVKLKIVQKGLEGTALKSKVSYIVLKSTSSPDSAGSVVMKKSAASFNKSGFWDTPEKVAKKLAATTAEENARGPWLCSQSPCTPTAFDSYYLYRRHLVDTHGERIDARICEYCGYKASKRNLLMYHIYTKHGIDPPKTFHFPHCDRCDYVALSDSLLAKHKLTHDGLKDFMCTICNAGFKSSAALQSHNAAGLHRTKVLEGFECPYCRKQFVRQMNLKAHVRTVHKAIAHPDEMDDAIANFTPDEGGQGAKKFRPQQQRVLGVGVAKGGGRGHQGGRGQQQVQHFQGSSLAALGYVPQQVEEEGAEADDLADADADAEHQMQHQIHGTGMDHHQQQQVSRLVSEDGTTIEILHGTGGEHQLMTMADGTTVPISLVPSSEAEAMNNVANSIVASLGLDAAHQIGVGGPDFIGSQQAMYIMDGSNQAIEVNMTADGNMVIGGAGGGVVGGVIGADDLGGVAGGQFIVQDMQGNQFQRITGIDENGKEVVFFQLSEEHGQITMAPAMLDESGQMIATHAHAHAHHAHAHAHHAHAHAQGLEGGTVVQQFEYDPTTGQAAGFNVQNDHMYLDPQKCSVFVSASGSMPTVGEMGGTHMVLTSTPDGGQQLIEMVPIEGHEHEMLQLQHHQHLEQYGHQQHQHHDENHQELQLVLNSVVGAPGHDGDHADVEGDDDNEDDVTQEVVEEEQEEDVEDHRQGEQQQYADIEMSEVDPEQHEEVMEVTEAEDSGEPQEMEVEEEPEDRDEEGQEYEQEQEEGAAEEEGHEDEGQEFVQEEQQSEEFGHDDDGDGDNVADPEAETQTQVITHEEQGQEEDAEEGDDQQQQGEVPPEEGQGQGHLVQEEGEGDENAEAEAEDDVDVKDEGQVQMGDGDVDAADDVVKDEGQDHDQDQHEGQGDDDAELTQELVEEEQDGDGGGDEGEGQAQAEAQEGQNPEGLWQ